MSSQFNILAHGDADEAAAILGGDNPPDDIASLRAALTNALDRIARLERKNDYNFLDDALNSGDGVYRP